VVVSGRFPDASGLHVAHLVSLDGFEDYLDGKTPPPTEGLRMVSLHSWAFTSIDDGKPGFGEIAQPTRPPPLAPMTSRLTLTVMASHRDQELPPAAPTLAAMLSDPLLCTYLQSFLAY